MDDVLDIHQRDAENTMRELAVREGIFCGVSSGGAVSYTHLDVYKRQITGCAPFLDFKVGVTFWTF